MPTMQSEMSRPCPSCSAILAAEATYCLSCGARLEDAPPRVVSPADGLRDQLARALGAQFEIERLLGRGGMGAVYLAHERLLNRKVAIKVLPPEVASQASDSRARFMREAQTAAQLTHRHIVPLHSIGEADGTLFFLMGYVEGESLKSVLSREGRLSEERTRRILGELADALAYAHEHGIVHRDLKPDNVMIEQGSGKSVLTDFGIAKYEAAGDLTGTGLIVGTPQYMSPEQASGERHIDGRSDLYSLGVLGYRLLSGRLPFEGSGVRELLVQHITDQPPPLESVAPGVSEDLAFAVMRCLAKNPKDRWPDAAALRDALISSQQVVKLAERRAWYDGLLLSYVLPAMFMISVFVVGGTVGENARKMVRTSVARAHAHRDSGPIAPGPTNASTQRVTGGETSRGASRLAPVLSPARWLVFGSGELPKYAVRFYVTTIVTTGILSLLCGLLIMALARVWRRDASGGMRRLMTLIVRQPHWWSGWVPNRFRHPAMAELRKRHPRWLVACRTVNDLAVLYNVCIILPVLIVIWESSNADLLDASIQRWPYVKHWWDGGSLLDRHSLLLGFSVVAALVAFVWATRKGLSLREAWRVANGEVLMPTPASLTFWRELDEGKVFDRASSGRAGREPATADEFVARIDQLALALADESADVGTRASAAMRGAAGSMREIEGALSRIRRDANPEELARIEQKLADLEQATDRDSPDRKHMRQLLEQQRALFVDLIAREKALENRRVRCADMMRRLWLELSSIQQHSLAEPSEVSQVSQNIAVLCDDLNRIAGANDEPTMIV